ncbi:MAG: hypothetical protein R6V83_11745 [Candidatus Thorarchaeota archaeon]
MLKREDAFIPDVSIYEVNIDRYHRLARAFSILVVPTLVAGERTLAGLPTLSDLQNFVLQASSEESTTLGLQPLNEFTHESQKETSENEKMPENRLLA